MKIEIIYETPDFLAVNKPAGLLVHPVKNSKELALTDWIFKKYPGIKEVGDDPKIRPGIVHRLDKDTSGVILICRNQKFFEYAKKLFQEHKIKKNYLALAYGEIKPKSGVIEKPISIKSDSIKRTIHKGKDEKAAITEYKVLEYFEILRLSALIPHTILCGGLSPRKSATFSLLKVCPKTGRTHQIRVHLASIGHPIVGDSLYGPKENPFGLKRQFLHAESLEFNSTNGSRIKIESELPDDLKNILDKLSDE